MKIYEYYDPDNALGDVLYKIEHEGRWLGSFEDPCGADKAVCFMKGWRLARGLPLSKESLKAIKVIPIPMDPL